jgi:hypothetical protein
MYQAGFPPGSVEDGEGNCDPEAEQTRLLSGPGLPGHPAAGCHGQAGGENGSISVVRILESSRSLHEGQFGSTTLSLPGYLVAEESGGKSSHGCEGSL